ncbi:MULTISPECIES: prepilin-type N-terminal cleavage/methylation domain-containing protein [unclassified Duganella]|uniref:prepilin-type N-terminal cleavage/methylation domain-containing protein n=1 Tax=unclassified Duganella TaxID=2636909 RepID=UPI000891F789|nr:MULTISPECIES: prepilin-type N-terminal cleavage/methylation domain-containing protein [unclassified Duganella]SDG54589.1 prepilin-type N-terminal cleavage/methylation domain-containing protein [Duganella sp. OV458]SDJ77214.1 prepilin-type N-terminal cleavage/methylation domain-containing protein [Duganella sp. OV510]
MNRKPVPRRHAGFTLVEIAIVLLIVGLMIGGLIAPLSSQLEQRRSADTRRVMDEAREALVGFALQTGYLPCPAISPTNGLEDRAGNVCNKRYGYLPWATLGVSKLDGWNRLMGYTVTPAFADAGNLFTLKTPRDVTIATRSNNGQLMAASGINDVPAAIISFGRNGYGATSDQGTIIADAGTGNIDEKTNLQSTGTALIYRDANEDTRAPGGTFDDTVIWLSPYILYNRMVAAQRLP